MASTPPPPFFLSHTPFPFIGALLIDRTILPAAQHHGVGRVRGQGQVQGGGRVRNLLLLQHHQLGGFCVRWFVFLAWSWCGVSPHPVPSANIKLLFSTPCHPLPLFLHLPPNKLLCSTLFVTRPPPTPHPICRFRFRGANPEVEEVGPFVYSMNASKVDATFDDKAKASGWPGGASVREN